MRVTKKGALLSAKTLQGKLLKFDHVEIGSGLSTIDAREQEELVEKEIECSFNSIKVIKENQIRISFLFTNKNIARKFYFREIGLFAIDPDTSEKILYAYANAGEIAEYISNSSKNVIEKYIKLNVAIDNAENVKITVNRNMTYVTRKEFEEFNQIDIKSIILPAGTTITNGYTKTIPLDYVVR